MERKSSAKMTGRLYRRGFSVAIAVLAVGLSFAIGRWIDDLLTRRKKGDGEELPSRSQDSGVENDIKSAEAGDVNTNISEITR